jgi:hypothetical protein
VPSRDVPKHAQTITQGSRLRSGFEQTTTRASVLDVTNFNSRASFALQILRLRFANARVYFVTEFHLNPLEIVSILALRAAPLAIG